MPRAATGKPNFGTILKDTSYQSIQGSTIMAATKLATLHSLPFHLSLRIKHPSLDPAEISKELGIEAEHSFRAGQPRHSKSGLAATAVHTESYWLAPLNPASWFGLVPFAPLPKSLISQSMIDAAITRNLATALGLCAVRFNSAHAALLRAIRAEGGEISLLVTISPTAVSSFNLPPQVSRTFGELGITLEFEITDD
jgi:hypothetical protein